MPSWLNGFENILISELGSGDINLTYLVHIKKYMQEYPIKRGFTKDLNATMRDGLNTCFGTEVKRVGDHYQVSYGALKLLDVTAGGGGKTLIVRTESDTGASDEVILDTNRRFRKYLDMVTGFSTKERVKRAKSVEEA